MEDGEILPDEGFEAGAGDEAGGLALPVVPLSRISDGKKSAVVERVKLIVVAGRRAIQEALENARAVSLNVINKGGWLDPKNVSLRTGRSEADHCLGRALKV